MDCGRCVRLRMGNGRSKWHSFRRCVLLAGFATGLLSCGLVRPASGADVFELGEIVVVGESESKTEAMITHTIEREVLEARHRDNLSEALDLFPGLAVQSRGARNERLVSVRGYNSKQVPLLIDGVPVYVPYDGTVDLARFGVGYVSRIAVSKGLASVLYGPNILGGVINVISRRPSKPLEAAFSLQGGFDDEFGTQSKQAVGSIGGIGEHWYGYVTGSYAARDGFRLPDDFEPTAVEDGGARDNALSRDSVISAKLGLLPDNGDEYALSVYRQHARKQTPLYAGTDPSVRARFWRWPAWDKESVYFNARNEITTQGTLRWRLYYDTFYNVLDSYDDTTYTTQDRPFAFNDSIYDDHTYGGNADFEWRWSESQISRVALHIKDDIHREVDDIASPQENYEDRIYSVAFEHEWHPSSRWTVIPGVAYAEQQGIEAEFNNDGVIAPLQTGDTDAISAQLIATYDLGPDRTLLAGVSQKTRFPTIKDRFSFRFGSALPNPHLQSEQATHFEIGYQELDESWGVRVALFWSELEDAIEEVALPDDACGSPPCFQQQNIGEQRKRGMEVAVDYRPVESLRFGLQGTFLDLDNVSRPDVFPTMTPERIFSLFAELQPASQWFLRAGARHESSRFSSADGSRITDDFTLVDVFLRWEPTEAVGLELGVNNATDTLYAYDEGYFEPGRNYVLQLDYRY